MNDDNLISVNKKELIDFLVETHEYVCLRESVDSFCLSNNVSIKITYKYAIELTYWLNGSIDKREYLRDNNNNIKLYDDYERARRVAKSNWIEEIEPEAVVYEKIVQR